VIVQLTDPVRFVRPQTVARGRKAEVGSPDSARISRLTRYWNLGSGPLSLVTKMEISLTLNGGPFRPTWNPPAFWCT